MKILKTFLLVCLMSTMAMAGNFKCGWWVRVNQPDKLAQFAAWHNTLVLADQGQWFMNASGRNTIKTFLDTAQSLNIKVIVGLGAAWNFPTADFVTTINTFKSHPALYAWYIGDEPELTGWELHTYLADNPGFYRLAKQNDPNHPVICSFNQTYTINNFSKIRLWYDVTDFLAIHAYSAYAGHPEFDTGEGRYFYDLWRQMVVDTNTYNKSPPMATCQGFGAQISPSRTPTYREIRYATFSAVVNGVDKVLYWLYDGIGEKDPASVENVRRMVAEMQSVGDEMNAGKTFSPDIIVNKTKEQLAYRYGTNGNNHVIVAVNIYNRMAGGTNLDDVQFTLPVDVRAVEVLHEGRTIPVINGVFTDSFGRFGVHIYRFVHKVRPGLL